MDDAYAAAQRLTDTFADELRRELPPGGDVFDVHTHLGNDIDGMVGAYEELETVQARLGITRAFVFCLDEPDRHPAFRAANDRTLAHAERSAGRLLPFVRLDLTEGPIEEAVRCLERGARGVKLHPRAQKFALTDERLAPVFRVAAERRVPILIHGGRGLPPIGDDLARLHAAYPDAPLIIAHAGIADMAGLTGRFRGRAGVYFDTSVWSPIDLLALYREVPPEQVVYASDYPYGQQPSSLLMTVRTARLAGYDDEQLRALLWGNAAGIAAGEPPLEPTAPMGAPTVEQPLAFARIHQYLSMAAPLLWMRQPDTIGVLGLALNTAEHRNGHRAETERIRELLSAARDVWRTLPELDDEREQRVAARATFRLVHLADILAVTTR